MFVESKKNFVAANFLARSLCPHPRHIAYCIDAACECERRVCGSSPKHCATHTANLRCILAPISAQRGQSPALLQAARKNKAINMPGASYISALMVQPDKHAGLQSKIQAPPRKRQPRLQPLALLSLVAGESRASPSKNATNPACFRGMWPSVC
jgi:hypothetical protein